MVCKRKLWLFSKGISMEHFSERVSLGKFLDETSFKDEEDYSDENVSIDFYTTEEGLVVHEIKLSRALEEAHIWQVKYYMYYLSNMSVKVSYGILHYPKQRKVLRVYFSEEDQEELKKILEGIEKILSMPKPPPLEVKPYCKKCAYEEFCYG
ncbi:CRISPR-associated protein Cas4 [Thermocrinis minervae]|uniref:CRISPR-associated protein Cas4 n=1 Tax=Thermocrinis minervae TaxID=381751 RepID=UPI001E2FC9CE|nr:CRISPR-associated protein Cas4 [Thermocrinis minervae]